MNIIPIRPGVVKAPKVDPDLVEHLKLMLDAAERGEIQGYIGGCLFESFNTLAAPDAWHAQNGYGANREMQQITIHRNHGIVARNVCGLQMARLAA